LHLAPFCLAESPFRARGFEYLETSHLLELRAVLPPLCRAVLVRFSHRAKLLPEVRQHRLAARLRLLLPRHQWLRQSMLQRQSL
jgi:hypothetical protein